MNRTLSMLLLTLISCGMAHGNALDPPERLARVSYLTGDVSLHCAGAQAPAVAALNWPMTSGDRMITTRGARAELSFGIGAIRLDEDTDLAIVDLDQALARLRVESGTISVQLRELRSDEAVELQVRQNTVHLLQPGDYRISVARDGVASIVVRAGQVNVDAGVANFQQLAGEEARIAVDRTVAIGRPPRSDEFDRWTLERKREFSGERSAQHVARGLVGYEDLDAYGDWRWERDYGMVWEPKRVATTWAPYRFGQWIWKLPWGWTWVDEAPWGFAPFHYGRWVYLHPHWCWVPGPRQIPPVYAPALVRWTEDSGERSPLRWFPLGPHEEYVPSYRVSEGYARSLNIFTRANGAQVSMLP